MNIREILRKTVLAYGEKSGFIFKGKEVSFRTIEEKTIKLANILKTLGVQKADKIAIFLPNCPEYAYSYLACFCLGAVGVPLDFMLKNDELISCLEHSESKVLVAVEKNDVDFNQIKNKVPTLKRILFLNEEFFGLMDKASIDFPDVAIKDSDPALIMYTSGTTGRPKGILLNYKHLQGSPDAMKYFVDLTDKDIKIAAIPFSHIGGFIYIQNCIIYGITLVIMERFNPFEFLENIAKYKITCFHIVPAMYAAILSVKHIEKFDLSSLRWVVVFGAPSSPEMLKKFHQYCPNAKFLNGWGMTETCPPNTVTPLGSDNIASVGKPSPNCKIRILDEQNKEVAMGEVGEIVISGWIVMDGYYKDEEETRKVKRNGALYTGDLGRFDAQGFLYIVGRKKEMIKVAGQIVYAPEVEAALCKNENVLESAVIGKEDKLRGEIVKAFVVLKQDAKITSEDLRYFAKEHLAHFKVPQAIEILEVLPKNRTGKIDKELLKSMD
ncbi:MAG TPA: AMP-binding protein [Candidatus Omnitrophota bacterium]|mgnify:FL=1|nr:AMP-binding protein [Candidatus Omnitrophota bacterium]